MRNAEAGVRREESTVLESWTARKVPPVVLAYVVLVFVGFMVIAYFVFHSTKAVVALATAAVGTVVATMPSLLERLEYRVTASGIERRPIKKQVSVELKEIVRWGELERVVPMRRGFKYFKTMPETGALRRFWNLHISDRYSGEVHVEREDLDRVLEIVRQRSAGTS